MSKIKDFLGRWFTYTQPTIVKEGVFDFLDNHPKTYVKPLPKHITHNTRKGLCDVMEVKYKSDHNITDTISVTCISNDVYRSPYTGATTYNHTVCITSYDYMKTIHILWFTRTSNTPIQIHNIWYCDSNNTLTEMITEWLYSNGFKEVS